MVPSKFVVLFLITFGFHFATSNQREKRTPRRKDCSQFDPNPTHNEDAEEMLRICTQSLQKLEGYLQAIGFHSTKTQTANELRNPCGSTSGLVNTNGTDWMVLNGSTCVKLLPGSHSFVNATELCYNEIRNGEDMAHPVVVSVDSSEKARDLLHILRGQLQMSYVWAVRKDPSPAGTVSLNCNELGVAVGNETEVEWRAVECGGPSGVVCEKPMVVSYVEVVRKQLEENKRADVRDSELAKAQGEIRQLRKELADERRLRKAEAAELVRKAESESRELREEMKSLLDSFRLELTEKVSRVESYSAANEAELKEVRRENNQLEEQIEKADGDTRKLRTDVTSLMDRFRADLVAQVESKSAETKAELRELKQQKQSLQTKLERLRTATNEDKRLRKVEEAKVRRSLNTLESDTSLQVSTLAESSRRGQLAAEMEDAGIKRRLEDLGEAVETNFGRVASALKTFKDWKVETAGRLESFWTDVRGLGKQMGQLRSPEEESLKRLQVALLNLGVWQLGGPKPFDLPKAMGAWHRIEAFRVSSKYETNVKCREDIFSLKGNNTLGYTIKFRWVSSSGKNTRTSDIQVDPHSPHQWTNSDHNNWLKVDYENWAITLGHCNNQSVSSCSVLWILSRTRTLPSATLDMLRDTAEANGFPKANGLLIEQTSC